MKFGIDDPIHDGISYDFSPNGMSIIAGEALHAKSNIIIKIYTGNGLVTAKGEVIWVSSIPDLPSKMGIKFNKPNERLIFELKS